MSKVFTGKAAKIMLNGKEVNVPVDNFVFIKTPKEQLLDLLVRMKIIKHNPMNVLNISFTGGTNFQIDDGDDEPA